jgi:trehalose 6-phosphate synthase/phosphatase
MTTNIKNITINLIKENFFKSKKRLLILDYDGTLVDFSSDPKDTVPSKELLSALGKLSQNIKNEIVIISGRDKYYLEKWFGKSGITLFAEHGVICKAPDKSWVTIADIDKTIMLKIKSVFEKPLFNIPGSILEIKDFSFSWHYRNVDAKLAKKTILILKKEILKITNKSGFGIMDGNNVLEVKNMLVNKGNACLYYLNQKNFDFILCMGDDTADEHMFEQLPLSSFTVKIGSGITKARFKIESIDEANKLLNILSEE